MSDLDGRYLLEMLSSEPSEYDDLVDSVEKLRAEMASQHFVHLSFYFLVVSGRLLYVAACDVRGHDYHRVSEVDGFSLPVGESPVVEDLEKQVERVCVRFFYLVEKHDGIGASSHRFGELPPFLVTHVSGRRSHQARHRVFFHVFAHVYPDHGVFVVEHELREGPGEFGFPHPRGPEKYERAYGSFGVG